MMLVKLLCCKTEPQIDTHDVTHWFTQSCVIMYVAIFAANKVLLPVYISLQDTRNVWMFYLR